MSTATSTKAIREAVECADAGALSWCRGDPWTGWGINGPSPWRDGEVKTDPDGALAQGFIGLRHYRKRTLVYVTAAGRRLLPAG